MNKLVFAMLASSVVVGCGGSGGSSSVSREITDPVPHCSQSTAVDVAKIDDAEGTLDSHHFVVNTCNQLRYMGVENTTFASNNHFVGLDLGYPLTALDWRSYQLISDQDPLEEGFDKFTYFGIPAEPNADQAAQGAVLCRYHYGMHRNLDSGTTLETLDYEMLYAGYECYNQNDEDYIVSEWDVEMAIAPAHQEVIEAFLDTGMAPYEAMLAEALQEATNVCDVVNRDEITNSECTAPHQSESMLNMGSDYARPSTY